MSHDTEENHEKQPSGSWCPGILLEFRTKHLQNVTLRPYLQIACSASEILISPLACYMSYVSSFFIQLHYEHQEMNINLHVP
jgi:hypothetical protein